MYVFICTFLNLQHLIVLPCCMYGQEVEGITRIFLALSPFSPISQSIFLTCYFWVPALVGKGESSNPPTAVSVKVSDLWGSEAPRSWARRHNSVGNYLSPHIFSMLALIKLIITRVMNGPALQWASLIIKVFVSFHAVSETSFFPNSHRTDRCLNIMGTTTQSLA